MTSQCTCREANQGWMLWDAHRSAVEDERCRRVLSDFYNTGTGCFKASTKRAPRSLETLTGKTATTLISALCPAQPYPQYDPGCCSWLSTASSDPEESFSTSKVVSVRMPNHAQCSFRPWLPDSAKPDYRQKSAKGVYVGTYPSVPVKRAVHFHAWNPDTSVNSIESSYRPCYIKSKKRS